MIPDFINIVHHSFYNLGIGWIIPAIIGGIIGYFIPQTEVAGEVSIKKASMKSMLASSSLHIVCLKVNNSSFDCTTDCSSSTTSFFSSPPTFIIASSILLQSYFLKNSKPKNVIGTRGIHGFTVNAQSILQLNLTIHAYKIPPLLYPTVPPKNTSSNPKCSKIVRVCVNC